MLIDFHQQDATINAQRRPDGRYLAALVIDGEIELIEIVDADRVREWKKQASFERRAKERRPS